MRHKPRLRALLLSSALILAPVPAFAQLVISQAYGGGGNSGATYQNDFVEIFNRGNEPVSLAGLSVQYGSSTGNFSNTTALPDASVQPGQYFLLSLAAGSGNGVPLPTADATGSLNLAGASGKVALVSGTTALGCGAAATPCSAEQLGQMVDLVGFGSANLFEGSAATPTLSNTLAAMRADAGCTDTNQNGADFTAVTPAPRNTATAANACGGEPQPTNPTASGSASPAALAAGADTLLSVLVQPGTVPTSTGITVEADLSAIGGSANQAFFDDGSNGDATPGDLRYSWLATVAAGTPGGAVSLPVAIADEQGRSASASIGLSIVSEASLAEIQGFGVGSPLLGAEVITEGVVTAIRSNGYFIQSAPGTEDGDPATAEGLFVFTSSSLPAGAVVGNRVSVSGRVTQFLRTPHGFPLTQLSNSSLTVLATDQPLPAAEVIDPALLQPNAPLAGLGRYQGMRVQLPAARVVGPTDRSGYFFVTLPDVERPVRTPGIAAQDVVPLPEGNNIPVFDRNPERLRVESAGLVGGTALDVDAGTLVEGMEGVMYYDSGDFSLLMGDRSGVVTSGGAYVAAVPLPEQGAIRIGSFNIENLSGGASVDLGRLAKLSEVFCQYLRNPDVVGLVEIGNLETAQRVAEAINTNEFGTCPTSPEYVAYMLASTGSQRLGFLVKTAPGAGGDPRVVVQSVKELFTTELLVNPDGSSSANAPLFDRAPLQLDAIVIGENGELYPLSVLLNHTLSLLDINSLTTRSDSWGTAGARSRGKRLQQAIKLSEAIEAFQAADPDAPLVLIGDYNAFDFNDGYVDVMGIIGGTEAPADQVLVHGDSAVTRPLVNLIGTKPAAERYSYVFQGNIQTLDHALVNQAVLESADAALYHARVNSDFATDNAADPTVPVRTSDHDPLVAELVVPDFLNADLVLTLRAPGKHVRTGEVARFVGTIGNAGMARALDTELTLALNTLPSQVLAVQIEGWLCDAPVVDGAGSQVTCARETALAAGAVDAIALDVLGLRDEARENIVVTASAGSRSRELQAADNFARAVLKVTGKPSRWTLRPGVL